MQLASFIPRCSKFSKKNPDLGPNWLLFKVFFRFLLGEIIRNKEMEEKGTKCTIYENFTQEITFLDNLELFITG